MAGSIARGWVFVIGALAGCVVALCTGHVTRRLSSTSHVSVAPEPAPRAVMATPARALVVAHPHTATARATIDLGDADVVVDALPPASGVAPARRTTMRAPRAAARRPQLPPQRDLLSAGLGP